MNKSLRAKENRVIAFANYKGGVGKTTSVAAIGAALASRGKKTLLIDLDSQQSLTACYVNEDEVEASIYDSLTEGTPLAIVQVRENLFLSPSKVELAQVELRIAAKKNREGLLRGLIAQIKEDFDYILLDCPPTLGLVTANALAAATEVYVPLCAEALPLKGLAVLDGVVQEIAKGVNRGLQVSGVFITRYSGRKINKLVEEALRKKYGSRLFSTRIRENINVAEAPLTRKSIFEYSPKSNGARDYGNLVEEILQRNKD